MSTKHYERVQCKRCNSTAQIKTSPITGRYYARCPGCFIGATAAITIADAWRHWVRLMATPEQINDIQFFEIAEELEIPLMETKGAAA